MESNKSSQKDENHPSKMNKNDDNYINHTNNEDNDEHEEENDDENSLNFIHRDSVFVNKDQIAHRRISREKDEDEDDDIEDEELNRNTRFNMQRQTSNGSQVRFKLDKNWEMKKKNMDNIFNETKNDIPSMNESKSNMIDDKDIITLRPTLSTGARNRFSERKRISFAHTDDIHDFNDHPSQPSVSKFNNSDVKQGPSKIIQDIQQKNDNSNDIIQRWDYFKSIPTKDEDKSIGSKWVKFFLQSLKLSTYIITFIIVLMTTIISKILLHLMASMTRVDKSIQICKRNLLDENDDQSTILPLYTRLELFSNERLQWIWLLYFVLISPDILLFFRSIHSCLFKNYSFPDFGATLTIIMASSFEVIGISLLIFIVLPSFDSIVGLMITNSLFLLPSFLHLIRIFSDNNNSNRNEHGCSNRIMKIAYSLAFLFQIISIIAWPILILLNNQKYESQTIDDNLFDPKHDDVNLCWIIPLSCILITIGYWENFLDDIDGNELSKKNQFIQSFYKIKHSSLRSKFAIYLFVSIWKCILHLIMMLLIQGTLSVYYDKSKINENNVDVKNDWKGMNSMIKFMFTNFSDAFKQHSITLITESKYAEHIPTIDSNPMSPVWIALIQIFSSFLCYQTINFVCKICIQPIGFALPITIAMPVTVSLAHLLGQIAMNDRCILSDYWHLFDYTFLNVPYDIFAYKYWVNYLFWIIWMLAFISQTIITNYIWISSKERLRSTGKLFMIPLYTTAFIDQSLMLNRCCNNDNNIRSSDENKNHQTSKLMNKQVNNKNDDKNDIHIIACATIWHETADELLQMLKSIMRVDKDQCCRLAATQLNVAKSDVDFYHFETHLFVDDAFKKGKYFDKNENDIDINVYVETMISVLDEAAQNVHQCLVKIRPPEIYLTPFGGRIEWQLPGRTKLIAHLKDKSRIRHRKRWSQVMYMYYLLGYRIYQQDPDRKDDLMENTFLLALDGDINFQPEAILLLVDLMKKNPKLGAACGRVHPIGNGPMAWYQKFEYAISHWLQKATEHVFGCVLCSPGCFSLFRASALADDNVMNRYTTKPTEARHYVQYDQGEDRWLCTLLLQQGWKVEYSAASDSFTHCPEGFDDFYVQRRRWMPSTMANIIDLLKSYKNTVRINENISSLYILYQAGLMLGEF